MNLKAAILSPTHDGKLFATYCIMGGPSFDPINDTGVRVNLFIENKMSEHSSLTVIAKEELATVKKLISNAEIPFLKIVQSKDDAEIIIEISRKHRKINGYRRSIVLTSWRKTKKMDELWDAGFESMKRQNSVLRTTESTKRNGPIPSSGLGAILSSPNFQQGCVYILASKAALATEKSGTPSNFSFDEYVTVLPITAEETIVPKEKVETPKEVVEEKQVIHETPTAPVKPVVYVKTEPRKKSFLSRLISQLFG